MKRLALPFALAFVAVLLIWEFATRGSGSDARLISSGPSVVSAADEPTRSGASARSSNSLPANGPVEQREVLGLEAASTQSPRVLRGRVVAQESLQPVEGAKLTALLVLGGSREQFASTRSGPGNGVKLPNRT